MRGSQALLICGLLVAFAPRQEPPSGSSLSYLYGDDHDGRIVADVEGRLEGRRLTIDIRAHGPEVVAPIGYEGFRGENLQTAHELERGLERGTLTFFTLLADRDHIEVTERGRFRIRAESRGRLEDRDSEPMIRALCYTADLAPAGAARDFQVEIRTGGAPRLVLHGRQTSTGGTLVRFERFRQYGPLSSATLVSVQEAPANPGTEPLEQLIQQLSDESPDVRRDAGRKIVARGLAVIPALEKLANAPDAELKSHAREMIRTIRRNEAERGIQSADPDERAAAMKRIAEFEGKDIFKHIEEQPDPKYIAALTDVVVYELSAAQRGKAVDALIRIGTPAVFPALLFAMRNPWNHGEPIASWLGAHGDLGVLGEIEKFPEQSPPMIAISDGIHKRFPGQKAEAPKGWTPIDPTPFPKMISEGKSASARIRGIRGTVNGGNHSGEILQTLAGSLRDSDEEVRFRAAEAFTFTGVGEQEPKLMALFKDEAQSLRARQMAAVALVHTGSLDLRKELVDALGSGPRELRITLAGALGDTGDQKLLAPMRARAEQEKDAEVRAAIERAVEHLRSLARKK